MKYNFKIYFSFACLMLIAFIAVGTITPSTIHAEKETLKVGTDTNYVPFEFLD